MKKLTGASFALVAGSLVLGITAQADTIVQWNTNTLASGTNVVTSDRAFLGAGATLNTATNNNPAYGSSAYYEAATYADFAAARAAGFTPTLIAAGTAGGSFTTFSQRVINGTGGQWDALNWQVNTASGTNTIQGMAVWQQSDFLPGYTSGSLRLNGTNAVTLRGRVNIGTNMLQNEVRLVLRKGTQFYVSDDFANLTTSWPVLTPDLSARTWAAFDPTVSIATPTSGFSSLSDYDDITAIGFTILGSWSTGATLGVNAAYFNVDAILIPEPNALALAFAGMGMVVILRRRGHGRGVAGRAGRPSRLPFARFSPSPSGRGTG